MRRRADAPLVLSALLGLLDVRYPPTYPHMTVLRFTIVPDEFLGLSALIGPDRADGGGDTGSAVVSKARALMRGALADKLQEIGLPWAPSAEAVKKRAAEAAEPTSGMRALMGNKKVRKYGTSVVTVAALVALWGGYVQGWKWTGFQTPNDQLWAWLSLLLLPVALGTIPLWIQDRDYISRPRRVAYGVVIVAWTGLVIGGYLLHWRWTGFQDQKLWDWLDLILLPVALTTTIALTSSRVRSSKARSLRPYQKGLIVALAVGWIVTLIGGYLLHWRWTGFQDQKLWDWLDLILLPVALTTTMALTSSRVRSSKARSLRPYQKGLIVALAVGWIVTVIGGYLLKWSWTGYSGNLLWDWLKLLLAPLVFPTILLPALLKWVSGNAARRASEARKPPMLRLVPDPRVAQVREHAQREHEIHSRSRWQNPEPPLDRPGLRQDIIDQFERKGLG